MEVERARNYSSCSLTQSHLPLLIPLLLPHLGGHAINVTPSVASMLGFERNARAVALGIEPWPGPSVSRRSALIRAADAFFQCNSRTGEQSGRFQAFPKKCKIYPYHCSSLARCVEIACRASGPCSLSHLAICRNRPRHCHWRIIRAYLRNSPTRGDSRACQRFVRGQREAASVSAREIALCLETPKPETPTTSDGRTTLPFLDRYLERYDPTNSLHLRQRHQHISCPEKQLGAGTWRRLDRCGSVRC
ncbi:hypothetical protein B0J18DRAFT_166714 [Chaetomium sp. MPI-SDFR-AT-0129]|nr:hypothetical protein B0J18DRAFT_166714 [Chaetomium sp. MPI-SDFR-AT-0129]